jgi:hypothetical protein
LATQTRARENQRAHQHLQRPVTARVHRQQAHQNLSHAKMVAEVAQISEQLQPTTADHASLALLRVHRPHVGKTAHRALSTATHAQIVTRAIHVTHVRQPVATSVATGAQHLLLAAATFSAMTVHHAELAKTARQELLIVTHVRLATTAHRARSIVTHAHRVTRVMVAHHVVSKIAQLARSIVTHVRLASSKTDHNVIRTSLVQPVLSEAQPLLGTRVTHAHRAIRVTAAVVSKIAQQELSTEQNLADHASSTTALASSTATIATTAPTVVRTVLTA